MEALVSIRGATSVKENTVKEIKSAVVQLLKEIIETNSVNTSKIVNIIFTSTHDLNAIHPAKVAREELDLVSTPMLCSQEMKVPDDLPRCIRLMMQVYTEKSKKTVKHIYLGEANKLRPDLNHET
ncbi:MAG: chorismate mutase [Candidatus Melainabacteria bacterium]|nr:chorismate mutase [Candidatus Melainabacteria bacterium]